MAELTVDGCMEGMKACERLICVDGRKTTAMSEMSLVVHPFDAESRHSSSSQILARSPEETTSLGHLSRFGLGHFIHAMTRWNAIRPVYIVAQATLQ